MAVRRTDDSPDLRAGVANVVVDSAELREETGAEAGVAIYASPAERAPRGDDMTALQGAPATTTPTPEPDGVDTGAPAGGEAEVAGRAGRRRLRRRNATATRTAQQPSRLTATAAVDIAPGDPFLVYLAQAGAPVDLGGLELDSPAVRDLRAAGVVLVVPLVSSGELIGALNLGPRLSEQGYSSDDRRLLDTLAGYAAPAMRVGQLVRAREVEARNVERIEQELRVAQLIQQQFLPAELPTLPGFHVAAFYRPARTIGGDFYDFAELPDGRIMFVCGDVTDKGVPAALVMASTHALLREAATRMTSPGEVLASVNDMLCADIPAHMFVTCLAIALDPATGHMTFANAGHNLPYIRTAGGHGHRELNATGMPLGLMPGMAYDETVDVLAPGEGMLLHSDGLAEAHDSNRQMFGFDRLAELVGVSAGGEVLIDRCLSELTAFTGPVEQEDDITLVTIERSGAALIGGVT
ncbi:PP2C family protein-serine/threonine phosphatase [uncultured Jatrophihabitans sp.]|uniref:PP2C family protein-serine/threonine phosphatase n=1 Tax=uncultured Jatrophihabitans sp. TaxID=1610747 RepID=UPI0035CB37CF